MSRIPVLKPEAMDNEQKRVYEDVLAKTGRASGGPSIAYAYVPGLWEANNSVSAYLENKSALTKAQVRIAALVTVRKWNSDFPWSAQARMALDSGIAREAVDAINARQRATFANAEDQAVHDVAKEMVETGTLTQASFDAAMKTLGMRKLIETVGAVGQFCKTAMVANLAGATAPADAPSKLTR
jgi:4-carboxymuconolactone decarboxylase